MSNCGLQLNATVFHGIRQIKYIQILKKKGLICHETEQQEIKEAPGNFGLASKHHGHS